MELNNRIKIIQLKSKDAIMARELVKLFQYVFKSNYDETADTAYLAGILDREDFMAFAAVLEDEVLGGITAYILPKFQTKEKEAFVYDLAIHPDYQRIGIGKKLLTTLKNYCAAVGINEIFLNANEEDHHAFKFYESAGASGERVIQYTFMAE